MECEMQSCAPKRLICKKNKAYSLNQITFRKSQGRFKKNEL